MNYLRMDLKVCEGCGALWLRTETTASRYCHGCSHRLAAFPAPRKRHAGGRPRIARASSCAAAVSGGAR